MNMSMTKREIEREAMSGGRVRGCDVARVARSKRYITLRHAWPEDVDARVWARVMTEARALALHFGGHNDVEIYDPRGWIIDVVRKDR